MTDPVDQRPGRSTGRTMLATRNGSLSIDLAKYGGAVQGLTLEEEGALVRLLRAAAVAPGGYLPNDETRLQRICCANDREWSRVKQTIMRFLTTRGDLLCFENAGSTDLVGLANNVDHQSQPGLASGKLRAEINAAALRCFDAWGCGDQRAKTMLSSWVKQIGPGITIEILLATDKKTAEGSVIDPISYAAKQVAARATDKRKETPSKQQVTRHGRSISRPADLGPRLRAGSMAAWDAAKQPLLGSTKKAEQPE